MTPLCHRRQLVLGSLALLVAVAISIAGMLSWLPHEPPLPPAIVDSRQPAQDLPTPPPPESPLSTVAARSGMAVPPTRWPLPHPPAGLPSPSAAAARSEPPAMPAPRHEVLRIGIHPAAEAAYQAMQRGELASAREQYQTVLGSDPHNRDALLGLAVTAWREGRGEEAARRYEQLLALDPRDADANAGLALLHGPLDPAAYESRLKSLLDERNDSAALHHALGSLLAGRHRWGEAHAAFLRAAALAPQAVDYQFNLAVSLDHLGHYALAGKHYRQALELAGGAATFDREAAQSRLAAIDGLRP